MEDKNILIASGASDSSQADGAGITIDGANESITWNHANSRFQISKKKQSRKGPSKFDSRLSSCSHLDASSPLPPSSCRSGCSQQLIYLMRACMKLNFV